ncbi:NAD(+)/NADH kinase [Allostreptomyces psammosilenae]|uniref:NAD kinase n=1 Tax=Allostreptomyces psammosilenae TaxID=1892865 RepID=A0A853ABD9_9ACTN|nr:NAD(+)/NADH kinase [Allostreptomyces psammosilenae]NYI07808.1 NAD kinase [Allostreptomyces psammosilenae]
MSLAPRAVLVHRTTEYTELVARHGTHGQAAFFLASRGRDIAEVEERHHRQQRALAEVAAAVPLDWRRTTVERADLARFLFAPEDVVVVVGPDGLVANTAKYLDGQPVIGVDTDPGRNLGVLVRHRPREVPGLLRAAASPAADRHTERRIMVQAVTDDRQRLLALNEIYLGHPTHQTARYRLTVATTPTTSTGSPAPGAGEPQASSGILVGTGTGSTGWCHSAWRERARPFPLPGPTDPTLAWFVREAWPSPATGTEHVQGLLEGEQRLHVTVESDHLVAFGDGIESDALHLTYAQTIHLGPAPTHLHLLA